MTIYSRESLESVVALLKRLSDQPDHARELGVFCIEVEEAVKLIEDRLEQEDVLGSE